MEILKRNLKALLDFFHLRKLLLDVLRLIPISSKYLGPPKSFTLKLHSDKHMNIWFEGKKVNSVDPDFLPRKYFLELPNGRLMSDPHCVISASDHLLVPVSNEPNLKGKGHVIFEFFKLPKIQKLNGKTLALASQDDNNYFHWLFQIFPKFKIIEENGFHVKDFDHILLKTHHHEKPFIDEFAEVLGIDFEKVKTVDSEQEFLKHADKPYKNTSKYRHTESDHLYVTPFLWELEAWMCHYIREKMLDEDQQKRTGTRRLYLSRRKATRRKILNEDQLWQTLERFNFELIELENYSIKEEADLFSSAQCVVSPTGAGLANIVYCNPGTFVIEMKTKGHSTPYSDFPEYISKHIDLKFSSVICESPAEQENMKEIFRDITVDTSEIKNLVEDFLPHSTTH